MSIQMANQNAPINKLISVQNFESDGKLKLLRGYFGSGFQVNCLLYTTPSPRDRTRSRMPSSA